MYNYESLEDGSAGGGGISVILQRLTYTWQTFAGYRNGAEGIAIT